MSSSKNYCRREVKLLPENVKCSVDSCAYWGHNNRCEAQEIEVNDWRGMSRDMEIGVIGVAERARTSEQTNCKTFKPKNVT